MKKKLLIFFTVVNLTISGCNILGSKDTNRGSNNSAPVIKITSHKDGDIFTLSHTVTLTGTVSDKEEVIESVLISINDGAPQSVSVSNGNFTTELTFISDINEVKISATDSSLVTSSDSLNLYYISSGVLTGSNAYDYASGNDSGQEVVIAENGSIYVCGYFKNGSGNFDLTLWRLNSDGSLDTSFNSVGYVLLDASAGSNDFGRSLTIDKNGNIIVVGQSQKTSNDMVVARYTSDGILDNTFATDGVFVKDISGSGSNDSAYGVMIIDDNIYVAGTSDNTMNLFKLSNNGTLDTSFANGTGSIKLKDIDGNNIAGSVTDMTKDNNGKILITGNNGIWRVTSEGLNDESFGNNGFVNFDINANAIKVDRNGKILVTGKSSHVTALYRYTDSGLLDSSFANNGQMIRSGDLGKDTENESASDLVLDCVGNILVVGESYTAASNPDMIIWRFTPDGVLDTTFGSDNYPNDGIPDGFISNNSAGGKDGLDQGHSIALDSLGNIVVTGNSDSQSTGSEMILWRFN